MALFFRVKVSRKITKKSEPDEIFGFRILTGMIMCSAAAGCRGVKRTAKRTAESKGEKKKEAKNHNKKTKTKKRKTKNKKQNKKQNKNAKKKVVYFSEPGMLGYHPRTSPGTFVWVSYVFRIYNCSTQIQIHPHLFFCVKHRHGIQTIIHSM